MAVETNGGDAEESQPGPTDETKKSPKKKSAARVAKTIKAKKAPKVSKAKAKRKDSDSDEGEEKRTRTKRPYPAAPFGQVTKLGEAIHKYAAGQSVRRLTLLEKLDMSPTSSATQLLITNSGKYGITKGSYAAEHLELTEEGSIATDPNAAPRAKLEAQFKLAIQSVAPFKSLYDEYKGRRLVATEVMSDLLKEKHPDVSDRSECIDIYIVNIKDLGLLRTIAGAETLVSIEQALEEKGESPATQIRTGDTPTIITSKGTATDWDKVCFYVTPIGDSGSDARKHSDLFKSSIIEPAMNELNLKVVRADEIENSGMIATSIIEHLRRSKLVIADLSMLNPNVFYEIGLRHACRLPIVQIIRKGDRLPFDLNQVNTLVIDNSDLYSFVPKIETFRAEIAALARQALANPESVSNPITVFYPSFWAQV